MPDNKKEEVQIRDGSPEFQQAAELLKKLQRKPSDSELLPPYAHFKQVTCDDLNPDKLPRPGVLNLKGKAKWDEWKKLIGMSLEDAEKRYIRYLNLLVRDYKLEDSAEAEYEDFCKKVAEKYGIEMPQSEADDKKDKLYIEGKAATE